jgi:hypothetical protein
MISKLDVRVPAEGGIPHLMDGALTDGGNFADGWDFVESVARASIRGRRLEPGQTSLQA